MDFDTLMHRLHDAVFAVAPLIKLSDVEAIVEPIATLVVKGTISRQESITLLKGVIDELEQIEAELSKPE